MINKIGVIGSGTMGSGIASVCALSGYDTFVHDVNSDIIQRAKSGISKGYMKLVEKMKISDNDKSAAESRLHFSEDIKSVAECNLIIEAAFEDLRLKKELYAKLNEITSSDTILASNTSSFSITAISAAVISNPARVIGMHFFNPANIMKLVEVVKGEFTSDSVLDSVLDICKKLGKTAVVCKDTPAFIVNRVARSFYGESLKLLGEGGINVKTIDEVMKTEGGFAMGPFELMDLIGIDVNLSVTKSVYEAFFQDQKYKPHPIQQKMVEAGMLGRKKGTGFYKY